MALIPWRTARCDQQTTSRLSQTQPWTPIGSQKPRRSTPDFSLHTIRSAATNFFEKYVGLPPAASSAFLAHGHKADKGDPNAMSEVIEKFYLVSQKMDLKIKAMQAWSDTVMEAYDKAGGKWPQPYPQPKPKTIRKAQ
jgi:hypothetical protein